MILITLLLAISISAREAVSAIAEMDDPDLPDRLAMLREKAHELQEQLQLQIPVVDVSDPIEHARERIRIISEISDTEEERDRVRQELDELRKESEADSTQLDDLRKEVELLESETRRLEGEIADARPIHSIAFIPERDTSKTPILVESSDHGLRVGVLGRGESLDIPATDAAWPTLQRFLQNYSTRTHYIVFMIKPSGLSLFQEARDFVRYMGYEVGFDTIEEQYAVDFGGH